MTRNVKKRHPNQKTGSTGEGIFAEWVREIGYSANKAEEDFGVDFFCQRFTKLPSKSEAVTGEVLLVQVRGTTKDRIKLTITDIATALEHQSPYCLVAVLVPSREVYFRMLDETLLTEWSAFLQSPKKSKTYRLGEFDTGTDTFVEKHVAISKPGFRLKLAIARANHLLRADIPNASYQYESRNGGSLSAATFPLLTSVFDMREAAHEDELIKILFRPAPFVDVFNEALGRIPIKESVEGLKDLMDGPHAWLGGAEAEGELAVSLDSNAVARPFKMRRVGQERGYISRSGLVIQISDPFIVEEKRVHRLGSSASAVGAMDLETSEDLPFLKKLRPGALMNEVGRPLLPIEKFGLQDIGAAVDDVQRVCEELDIPLSYFYLADLNDREFCRRLGVILQILKQAPGLRLLPSFVMGFDAATELDEALWVRCEHEIPIFLKLKQYNICARVHGTGEVYVYDGLIRGFRSKTTTSVMLSTISDEIPGDGTPVACYVRRWPRIKIIENEADWSQVGDFPSYGEFLALG